MDRYRRSLHESDSLLIYYAGHGYADREEEKAYWLPVDADRSTTAQWIIADELTSKMRVEPALHVLMISDSCYSGVLLRDGEISVRPDDTQMYLKKMLAGRSRTLMASGGNEPVADGGGDGHSVFARALLKALESTDAKTFTAGDMFHDSVLRQVAGNADQTPQYSSIRNSGDDAGDFVFMRSATEGKIERVGNAVVSQSPVLSVPRPAGGGLIGGAGKSDVGTALPNPEEMAKQGQALYFAKRYAEAVPLLKPAADAGDVTAQVECGIIFEKGSESLRDFGKAVNWFRKAAEQGSARGQNDLGLMYETGEGVAKDEVEGTKLIRKAAEQGLAEAQVNLGVAYRHGAGVTRDDVEAAKWYRKAAERGDASGQFHLGYVYQFGYGVEQDDAEAARWYRRAAEGGDANGQRNLGNLYQFGTGVDKDEAEAVKWYRKAAAQGDAGGEYELGSMYESGRGVKKDLGVALYWYEKAAAQADAPAVAVQGRDVLRAKKVVAKAP
jgi:TPR repeat protein